MFPSLTLLEKFHDSRVRDLVWVMAACGLLSETAVADFSVSDAVCRDALTRAMPQLIELDSRPAPLLAWIAARNPQRLGPYFETLLAYWLTHLMGGHLIAANLPVKEGNLVLGEYDFLWRDAAGALHHWEASVKFYLQVDAAAGLAGYVGTLTRDRLDLKFAHLKDKQLKLASTAAGKAALPSTGELVSARALLKGWLFYPHGQAISPAPEVSQQHLSGWWLRWDDTRFDPEQNLRWKVLPRLEWLTPARSRNGDGLKTQTLLREFLTEHFAVAGGPILIAGLAAVGDNWQELTRGFIVPSDWNPRKADMMV